MPASAAAAALDNGASASGATWSVFGRPETGWAVYAPLVAHELGSSCRPDQAGFAQALGHWQATHGLPADGVMTAETLKAMDVIWLRRRPFVLATRRGGCPPPPPDALLSVASQEEGYLGKPVRLQVQALSAYRRLVAAARAALPEAAADPRLFTLVSGYRGPEEEAARCAKGGCGSPGMARCSAHRTGMAMDLFLGSAPGYAPTSSDDVNRAAQSQSPAYLWLVANADRFGFAPYPFEPWHWEYVRG